MIMAIIRNKTCFSAQVPDVTLFEDSPGGKVGLAELCQGKKVWRFYIAKINIRGAFVQVVVFGVPGAFTPGCSKTHLPGYVEKAADIKGQGVQEIVCVSVNDPFVMEAWGRDQGAAGKVGIITQSLHITGKNSPKISEGFEDKCPQFQVKD